MCWKSFNSPDKKGQTYLKLPLSLALDENIYSEAVFSHCNHRKMPRESLVLSNNTTDKLAGLCDVKNCLFKTFLVLFCVTCS